MDYLMLVGRFEPIPEGFEAALKLRSVQGKLFEMQTAAALERMLESARSEGVFIKVISGYRSQEHQQMLWEKDISMLMAQGAGYKEAVKEVGRTLALPGFSEHHTGLAADLGTPGDDDVSYTFTRSIQAKWLECNAHKYGFILRYPRLKEHITGIDFEPWHYRYVGVESAVMIRKSGICLEEFLDFYQDKYLFITNRE